MTDQTEKPADMAELFRSLQLTPVPTEDEKDEEAAPEALLAPSWKGPLTGYDFRAERTPFGMVMSFEIPASDPIVLQVGFPDRARLQRGADDTDLALAIAQDPGSVPDDVIVESAGSIAYMRVFFQRMAEHLDPKGSIASNNLANVPPLERGPVVKAMADKQAMMRAIAERLEARLNAAAPEAMRRLIDTPPANAIPA